MLFGSSDHQRRCISHPLHPRDGWERCSVVPKCHHFLDRMSESIRCAQTTCEVISCPHQRDRGVLALLLPNVLQQRQKASVRPLVRETCTGPLWPHAGRHTAGPAAALWPLRHHRTPATKHWVILHESQKRYMTCKLDLDVQTLLAPVVRQSPKGRSPSELSRSLMQGNKDRAISPSVMMLCWIVNSCDCSLSATARLQGPLRRGEPQQPAEPCRVRHVAHPRSNSAADGVLANSLTLPNGARNGALGRRFRTVVKDLCGNLSNCDAFGSVYLCTTVHMSVDLWAFCWGLKWCV